jgi:adenylate cyclase, class 1
MAVDSHDRGSGTSSAALIFGEHAVDGWATAEPFFHDAVVASERLTENENRGIARMGRRIGRFVRFNLARFARIISGLDDTQRNLLAIVPYLLHINEPDLPGHVDTKFDVAGVSGFHFNPTVEEAALALFNRNNLRPPVSTLRPVIRSILMETDTGTMAARGDDPITFYLVVELRGMGDSVRRDLLRRLEKIRLWVEQKGLPISFILVDPAWSQEGDFGNLRGEHARGMLLMERFYRNATYVVGDIPVFWCTTPGCDLDRHRRTSKLTERVDFDNSVSFVDLGFVDFPPVKVRRRAMLSLVNHDPVSPLGMMLDLVLLVYGANASAALCEHLKSRVFKGNEAAAFVDPYVLTFDAACVALAHHGEWEKFHIVRKIFLFKMALIAFKEARSRRGFIKRFAENKAFILRWGWNTEVPELVDRLQAWSLAGTNDIDRELRDFVLSLYREVNEASRNSPGRFDEEEIALLGRRLVACFGRAGGQCPTQFTYLIHESKTYPALFIFDQPDAPKNERWAVFHRVARHRPPPGDLPVFHGESLAAVLTWLVVNEVMTEKTDVRLISVDSLVSTNKVGETLSEIKSAIRLIDPLALSSAQFGRPRRVERAVIIVNFDQRKDSEKVEGDRRHYLPSNWDILNYGRDRDSQVRDIAVITRDSWDQVHCRRARGKAAVRLAMQHVFSERSATGDLDAPIMVLVPEGRTQRAVHDRFQQLIGSVQEVVDATTKPKSHRTFAYEVGGRFQIVRREEEQIRLFNAQSLHGVVRLISPSGLDAQSVKLDALSPTLADLRGLIMRRSADSTQEICIGWRASHEGGHILICDQTGRIYYRAFEKKHFEQELLRAIRRIIHALRNRVRDMRTLRKVLRIYEMRDGRTQGDQAHLYEDTVRLLRILSEPRSKHPEVFLRGDFSEGREGIYFEYDGEDFKPSEYGRSFACELVERLVEHKSRYAQFDLFIEASTVTFPDNESGKGVRSVVRQLRLIDIYERLLARALRSLKVKPSEVMSSHNSFRTRGID